MTGFAVVVGLNTKATERAIERVMEDGAEVVEMAQKASALVSRLDLAALGREAYAVHFYMPSKVLDLVSRELQRIEREL